MAALLACETREFWNRRWQHRWSPFDGIYLHASIPAMAAAYLFHITQNHPFLDGNKRTGAKAALVFLGVNDLTLAASEDELVEITLAVASSRFTKQQLTEFFEKRCRSI